MQTSKRILKIVIGFLLLGVGIPMLFLPGPGWATILLGLVLLATEYRWAERLLTQMKTQTRYISSRIRDRMTRITDRILH